MDLVRRLRLLYDTTDNELEEGRVMHPRVLDFNAAQLQSCSSTFQI